MFFLEKLKISQKVLFIIVSGLFVFTAFALGTISMGVKQIEALEEIYTRKVVPLDKLRNMQLIFRELEYRMAGVVADIVTAIGSGEHLELSLKEIDTLWNDVRDRITDQTLLEEKEKFQRGYQGFKNIAVTLREAYLNDDAKTVPDLLDEYLNFKPLIFKSIDKMAITQEKAVKEYYLKKKKAISRINKGIIILSILMIVVFISFGIAIVRSITRPVKDTVEMLQDIVEGKGDLTKRVIVNSEDEIGTLSRWFNRFIEGMQDIVRGLLNVSREVTTASHAIRQSSNKVHGSAQTQMQAIETTSSSAEEVSSSIKQVSNDTEEVQKFTEDASTSSYEISAVVSEIASHAQELDSLTDRTASSINQIAASLKQVGSGVENLFTESENVAAVMSEMNKSINDVNLFSKELASMSGIVKENASELGLEAVRRTRKGIKKIEEEMSSIASVIHKLAEMSSEIGTVVEVINGITESTTLLSLNAAILAAQAGEHGKGFAVVAEEVKELAESTSHSTMEIEKLIKQVQDKIAEAEHSSEQGMMKVEEGVKLSEDAERALTKIIDNSEISLDMAKQIERAIEEQTKGVHQVTENINRINAMVDEIKNATGEQNKASEDILLTTENVINFTQMVKKSTSEQSSEISSLSQVILDASQRMKAISKATGEQKKAIENIVRAMDTLMEESEKNVRLASELDEMVNNLETQGTILNKQVESFKL